MGLVDEKELQQQISQQQEFFNSVVGTLSFTLGLACLGTPNPTKAAAFCLVIIVSLLLQARRYFPDDLKVLRDLAKETDDSEVKALSKRLEKRYIGWRAVVTGNPAFWGGYIFYFLILLWPSFVSWISS